MIYYKSSDKDFVILIEDTTDEKLLEQSYIDGGPYPLCIDINDNPFYLKNSEIDAIILALIEYRMNCKDT